MNEFKKGVKLEKCDSLHTCCDVCTCRAKDNIQLVQDEADEKKIVKHVGMSSSHILSDIQQKEIHHLLISLRRKWCMETHCASYLLMGEEVCTGLSNGAIQHIINNFDSIDNELDLGIRSYDYCKQILYILQSFK